MDAAAPSSGRKKLGCLRVILIFVVAVAVLIVLLYVEEDWRGARELAAAKARWQAAGYSLNPADYYPPPVPDDQNLAALPVFKLEPDPKNPKWIMDVRLRDALDEDKHGGWLRYRYNVKTKKEVTDLAENVKFAYAKMFPGKTPPASLLAQLEELYPVIVDLRTAAQTRPAFRMNFDYGHQPLWEMNLGPSPRKSTSRNCFHMTCSWPRRKISRRQRRATPSLIFKLRRMKGKFLPW